MNAQSPASARTRPRIGLTIGDPAGIGPEVTLKAASEEEVLAVCAPVIIGDAQYLSHWARVFGLSRGFDCVNADDSIPLVQNTPIIYSLNNIPGSIEIGREQAECGRAAAQFIEAASRLCLSDQLDAMTTAPINKKSLYLAGYPFPGHTEFLAQMTGTDEFAMAFITPMLRVALLTTHMPLADVPGYVKRPRLESL